MAVNTFSLVLAVADSPNVTGSWKIEITFANDQHRFLRFDAQNDGKGTLTVTDRNPKFGQALNLPRQSGLRVTETR